jgi:hypothetical protein
MVNEDNDFLVVRGMIRESEEWVGGETSNSQRAKFKETEGRRQLSKLHQQLSRFSPSKHL